ncbi:MAG: class I SAM-dependent methyltransferase [Chloroflexota bacterium]
MQDSDYFLELQTQTGWGRVLSRFADWLAPQSDWLTLDIGCGPGLLPALLAKNGCHAYGVDFNPRMFHPQPLHHQIAVADTFFLPFGSGSFDLVTASNLLFLLPDPKSVLEEMQRVLTRPGQIAVLNPAKNLNLKTATQFANSRNLGGLPRDSLLSWASRAEAHHRWNETDLSAIFKTVGMQLTETITTVGPGFARLARANWE